MKKTALFLLSLVCVGLVVSCRKAWVEFKSPDGSFLVEMPQAPIMKPAPSGTSWRASDGDIMYVVSTAPIPAEFKDPTTTERLFDSLQKAAAGTDKPPASRRRVTTVGPEQYPGREILLEHSTGFSAMRGRAYRAHDTLIFLTVFAPMDKLKGRDIDRFLESLRILKGQTSSSPS